MVVLTNQVAMVAKGMIQMEMESSIKMVMTIRIAMEMEDDFKGMDFPGRVILVVKETDMEIKEVGMNKVV